MFEDIYRDTRGNILREEHFSNRLIRKIKGSLNQNIVDGMFQPFMEHLNIMESRPGRQTPPQSFFMIFVGIVGLTANDYYDKLKARFRQINGPRKFLPKDGFWDGISPVDSSWFGTNTNVVKNSVGGKKLRILAETLAEYQSVLGEFRTKINELNSRLEQAKLCKVKARDKDIILLEKYCPNCGHMHSKFIGFETIPESRHNRDSGKSTVWNPALVDKEGYKGWYEATCEEICTGIVEDFHMEGFPASSCYITLGNMNRAIELMNSAFEKNVGNLLLKELEELSESSDQLMLDICERYRNALEENSKKEAEIKELEERLSKLKGGK